MINEDSLSRVKKFILSSDIFEIKSIISNMKSIDASEFLKNFIPSEQVYLLKTLENPSKIFVELNTNEQVQLLSIMKDNDIEALLKDMKPDDRTYIFESLDERLSKRLFNLLKEDDKKILNNLLAYPEHSVGRLMTTDYITVMDNITVERALDKIKRYGSDSEMFSTIYVVAKDKTLKATVAFRTLFFSPKNKKISSIMNKHVTSAKVFDDENIAIILIKKYNLMALPVIDAQNKMLGIVTVDDIMDIASEEDTENFHRLAGITHTDDEYNQNIKYARVSFLYKKRIPWLITLVFVNIFSAAVMGFFQSTINKYIILIAYIPILIGSAGNAGSQSSIIIIRSLATGYINTSDWLRMFFKEIIVSLLLGITMALSISLIGLYKGGIILSIIVGFSMVFVVIFGSIIGFSLPFIFKKINIDPAISSTPLITSLCDIVGISLYLLIARTVLAYFSF